MSQTPVNYILCSNPRSGTTLLCTMLEQSGVAGRPNSFFRQKSLQDWCDAWNVAGPVDRDDVDFTNRYFAAMRTEGRADTPVFGLRLMGPDLSMACEWLKLRQPEQKSDAARFDAEFGPLRYVHLSRKDKLAEAVSYLRAEQTGLWHQNSDGTAMEQIAPTRADGFDAGAITQRIEMLRGFDEDWNDWFEVQGIVPLRLTYEALAEDPKDVTGQVIDFIGQDPSIALRITPALRKLADQTSADWIARYRAHNPLK